MAYIKPTSQTQTLNLANKSISGLRKSSPAQFISIPNVYFYFPIIKYDGLKIQKLCPHGMVWFPTLISKLVLALLLPKHALHILHFTSTKQKVVCFGRPKLVPSPHISSFLLISSSNSPSRTISSVKACILDCF